MKKCDKCKISFNTTRKTCPLCNERLEVIDSKNNENEYPSYTKDVHAKNLFNRICGFSVISISLITVMINLFTRNAGETFWSIYIVGGLIYIWILLKGTIFSKGNIAMKLVVQVIALSLLSFLIDKYSNSNSWSLNYVTPFLTISSTASIAIILLVKKIKYSDYLLYLLASIALGFAPVVLYFTGLSTVLWPAISSSCFSLLVIFAMIFFADRETKSELHKRFHI